jgi:Flp pilus assembly protein TadD
MNKLAAFVGHSFSEQDGHLVNAFLTFLTTVSSIVPGFSWDHAEEAEPKVLSEKVRAKMEGKNLFIAICTAKERAIYLEKITQFPIAKSIWYGNRNDFESKTSDWVTQEIAYALGRGMDLIVLLEDGVRVPGGLQGDLEYIPFGRDAPSDSFNKILQMLKSLTPRPTLTEAAMPTPAAAEKNADAVSGDSEYEEPQASWKRNDYENAIFKSVWSENIEQEKHLIEVFSKSPLGTAPAEVAELEGYAIYLHGILGKGFDLSRLRQLVEENPADPRLRGHFASSLQRFSQYEDAARELVKASELATPDVDRANYIANAAIAKHKAGDIDAERWLRAQFKMMPSADIRILNIYLWALRQLSEGQEAVDRWLCYAEARLQSTPEEHSFRADLAYKYFEQERFSLALLHFLRIPTGERSNAVWNNIGASYTHMKVPGRSIVAYQKSQDLGGTTAVSNLAYTLIESGFFKEAEELCRKVIALPECDKRVAAALSSMDSVIEKETEGVNKALDAAKIQQRFLVDLGFACAAIDPTAQLGRWKAPDCDVDVVIGPDNTFTAIGQFVRDETAGLRGLLATAMSGGATARQVTVTVSYTGKIVGRGCFYTRIVSDDRAPSSLLGSSSVQGYLIVSEDALSMRELRRPETGGASFYNWTKLPT